jgi:hypothetical protein
MISGCWCGVSQGGTFHDDHFAKLRGVDVRNRCRQTLAYDGIRTTSRGLQWELDEWAVGQFQTRERKNVSEQSDWPENETDEVEVKECEAHSRTRLAAAARPLQTQYPYE